MIQDEFSRPYSNGAKNGAVEIHWESRIAWYSEYAPLLRLGRYPTTRGSGRMSPRGRNKFLFAGFGRISVTRLLSLQGKTEKETGIFCTKQPLCAMFYGGFLLFEAVRPRNLAAGTEKSEPRKRNSRPRNSFFEPRIFPDFDNASPYPSKSCSRASNNGLMASCCGVVYSVSV